MTSGLSQGPNSPLRSTWSMGLTMLMSTGGDWPPQVEIIACGLAIS